jgi:hypothetical protein
MQRKPKLLAGFMTLANLCYDIEQQNLSRHKGQLCQNEMSGSLISTVFLSYLLALVQLIFS